MKQYPKYKDSGIQWIGQIPEEWKVQTMKHLFYLKGRIGWQGLKAEEFVNEGPYLITGTDFENGKVNWERCYHITKERYLEAPEIHVKEGDLLITKDGTIGKLAYIDILHGEASLNSHLLIIRPLCARILNKFTYWFLQSEMFMKYTKLAQSGSIMESLSQEKVSNFKFPLPPLFEQENIVAYLDDKTSKIDECLRLLELQKADLTDYRKAIISEIIIKAGGKLLPLKYFLLDERDNMRVGPFGSAMSGNDFKTEGVWVYNQRSVLDNNFKTNDTFINEEKFEELKNFEVFPNDVLITTRGTIGKIAIVPEDAPRGVLHPCLIRCKFDFKKIHPSILLHLFNNSDFVTNQFKQKSNATTIDVIYSYSLKNITLPVIPLEEQEALAKYLDTKTAKIDETIANIDEQITDLRAYRSALISDVVTGKIDVRN